MTRRCLRKFRWGLLALLLVLAALAVAPVASARQGPQSARFLVYLDGHHVGSAEWSWDDTPGAERFVEQQTILVAQRSGRGRMQLQHESWRERSGDYRIVRRFGAGATSTTDGARLGEGRFVSGAGAGELPAGMLLPAALPRWLGGAATGAVPDSSPAVFDLRTLRPQATTLSACTSRELPAPCVRLVVAGRAEEWRFDGEGRLLRVSREFAGLPLQLRRCDADCGRPVDRPFDPIGHLVVASPHRIPKSAAQQQLRYVIAREDGAPAVLAATGDQRVVRDGARAVVSVCRDCGDAPAETPASLAPFLRANAWIQSGDARVRRLAARVGGRGEDVDTRMRRSVVVLAERLKGHFGYIGYADAAQVLRLGQADCTGYAVVLAAIARAQGIPARVVVGMAYADRFSGRREVFSPHAWVQAWDGQRWRSYDAALLDFDSTHVALAVGDGDPAAISDAFLQLAQLRIEKLGVVKSP